MDRYFRLHMFWALAVLLFCGSASAVTYDILIESQQEVPAPTLGGATPSGEATVTVDTLTGLVTVAGTYTGMSSNVSAAHLHGLASAGTNAGVLFALTPSGGTAGTLTGSSTLSVANLAGLLAGETYINVHTVNNGSGEIRGQVVDPDIEVIDVSIDSDQEVPAPTLGGATPSGAAVVVVDKMSGEVEISGGYTGMTSNVTASHLHGLAPPGTPAGVIFALTNTGGTDGTLSGSSILSAGNLAGFLQGLTYINVHTVNNGPGEIRGQVVPSPLIFADGFESGM